MSKEKHYAVGWIIMLGYYEKAVVIYTSLLLIILNLGSLYFIADLMSYDEIVGYLSNGEIKSYDPYLVFYVLFITTLFDILFVFAFLCSWFARKNK